MRTVIVQNFLGRDGRSKTVEQIIYCLNQRDLVPEILTFSSESDIRAFADNCAHPIDYRLVPMTRPRFLVGDLLQETLLPYLIKRELRNPDLLITSGTTIHGPASGKAMHLVYFPLELTPENEERYQEPLYRLYGAACRVLLAISAKTSSPHGTLVANSEFTRNAMRSSYPDAASRIEILYPPIAAPVDQGPASRSRAVVSLGGFHQDKRQLEQIEAAAALPDVQFYLVGGLRSRSYFERCAEVSVNLPNVKLIPEASRSEVADLLSTAKVFLHSKRNEHFGMSSAEAIRHGCIPVVHDSGGQREVVSAEPLRFRTTEDLPRILRAAVDGEYDHLLPELVQTIETFSEEAFNRRFDLLLDGIIGKQAGTES